jgi:hypothetical protein
LTFPIAETPLSATPHLFPIDETSLFNNLSPFSPLLKHHSQQLFAFSLLPKHYSPTILHISSSTKQHRPTIVSPLSLLLLKHHCQQPFTILPIAETPLTTNFPHFLPLLKHHCSTVLHISSSTKQHRPTIVSPLSFLLLKHH